MDLAASKPLTLKCGLTVPNRLVKAAMIEIMTPPKDHLPDKKFHRVYAEWAKGGWGMVLTGNVMVDTRYLGNPNDPAVGLDMDEAALLASWRRWAEASTQNGTITLIQLNHPGRQSAIGAGSRSLFAKNVAPSPTPLNLGRGLMNKIIAKVLFGTPRALTIPEIDDVVARFAYGAKMTAEAGFSGVEIHAAHGYLLAQFLSSKINFRTDAYGGTPAKRAKIVVDVIKAIRAAVPKSGFCVGIKLNSVDHQSPGELEECIEQLKLIVDAGVDFIEVSGGTYEDPKMFIGSKSSPKGDPKVKLLEEEDSEEDSEGETKITKSERTIAREAFFLDFAKAIRSRFPDTPLMVTGGFRTRAGIEYALHTKTEALGGVSACDMVGLGRPAVIDPHCPKNTVLNVAKSTEEAVLEVVNVQPPWYAGLINKTLLGVGTESDWYSKQIQNIGL